MLAPGFEWFVAWRHLRDQGRQSRRTLTVGLVLLVLGVGAVAFVHVAPHVAPRLAARLLGIGDRFAGGELLIGRPTLLAENLKTFGFIGAIAGLVLTILGTLFANFTVFTAISIFGVFLGTGAPVIALSVMSGFEADLKSKIRATKADVVVSRDGEQPFSDWEEVEAKLRTVDGVIASMAYVESEVIIKHISNPAGMGIILRGIDAARAPQVLDLARTLKEGKVEYLLAPEQIPVTETELLPVEQLPPSEGARDGEDDGALPGKRLPPRPKKRVSIDTVRARQAKQAEERAAQQEMDRRVRTPLPGILLGDELYARTLRVFVGSDVDVACPLCGVGPTGPTPKLKPFRVAGHFYTGMYEFDSKLAYVSLQDAQKFLGMAGEVTGIEVHTRNPDRARDVADAIAAKLGPGYEVRSWEELNRGLFMALKLEKIAMFVVLTFIALVASFSIVSNLIMLVTEKGREIAILKSMGARDGAILRVFFAEGLYIGLLGLGLGLALGIGGCLLISRYGLPLDPDVYYIQKLPVVMRGMEIASVALAALGLCCLATLYPAFLASRMRPVDGLRYE
ncbi:MAG TPA: ABC transporter permease [Polyangia bacterium]|nr:ABC transporter permease [Polyangia bacterium]